MQVQEETRTLAEFYPNPAIRSQVHFHFAHRFLPQDVHQNPYKFFIRAYRQDTDEATIDPTRLIQSRWALFEEDAGLGQVANGPDANGLSRRVSDLSMFKHEVSGKPILLVTMPLPEAPLQAFFVAIALMTSSSNPKSWADDVRARIFTLETEMTNSNPLGEGVVCEWTRDFRHENHGFGVRSEPAAFLHAVESILNQTDSQQGPEVADDIGTQSVPQVIPVKSIPEPVFRDPLLPRLGLICLAGFIAVMCVLALIRSAPNQH